MCFKDVKRKSGLKKYLPSCYITVGILFLLKRDISTWCHFPFGLENFFWFSFQCRSAEGKFLVFFYLKIPLFHLNSFFLFSPEDISSLLLEREEGRERNIHTREKYQSATSLMHLDGDQPATQVCVLTRNHMQPFAQGRRSNQLSHTRHGSP